MSENWPRSTGVPPGGVRIICSSLSVDCHTLRSAFNARYYLDFNTLSTGYYHRYLWLVSGQTDMAISLGWLFATAGYLYRDNADIFTYRVDVAGIGHIHTTGCNPAGSYC